MAGRFAPGGSDSKVILHEPADPFRDDCVHHTIIGWIVWFHINCGSSVDCVKTPDHQHSTFDTAMPRGFGRSFARWAKMPVSGMVSSPRGLRTRCLDDSKRASCRNVTIRAWENASMPCKPLRYSGKRTTRDSTSPQCSSVCSFTGDSTYPIILRVMKSGQLS